MQSTSFLKPTPDFMRKRWHTEGEDWLTNKATAHLGERFAISKKDKLIQPVGNTVVSEKDMDAIAYLIMEHDCHFDPKAYSAQD